MELTCTLNQFQTAGTIQPTDVTRRLADLHHRGQTRAWLARLWARLGQRSSDLHHLADELRQAAPTSRHYIGLHTIAISQIHGSESRADDFDAEFNPTSSRTLARWLNVARARLNGVPLPPVDLIEVNGHYFVRDGHHRISVARALGETFIEAEVTAWRMGVR